ncbi:hypothetical protein DR950_01820 [Kitasatospora xanthocidica]|uniref:Uncharacterized protein n=1 Tax=Kitasatospora xanthocidica TaxID=83382 RepID=A0A372ZN38_9ACTN|nr:hypothetical protein [Kitasatospora xanthocidica]RGD56695.1 hypothetical protein DR950_01820 [Kitasatospora xanthocidica]
MTGTEDNDYCAVFVQGASRQDVTGLVAAALGVPADEYTVRFGDLELDIQPNPDAGLADEFVGWPLKIDVEGRRATMVDAVSRFLTAAWDAGYQAVAACDFESELPELGGYPRYRA